MIEHLYVNGCSHAMDYHVREQGIKQYADLLSAKNKWTLNNYALPGTCNQRIIRSTVKDSLTLPPNTLALISLTYLDRTEIGVEDNDPRCAEQDLWPQDYFVPIKSDGWAGNPCVESYAKEYYKLFDWYSAFVNLTTGVLLLTQLFKQRNIQYLIFNYNTQLKLSQQLQIKNHPIIQELEKDSRVLSLVSDHLTKHLGPGDWYYDGNLKHLNKLGHTRAAEIIQDLLNTPN